MSYLILRLNKNTVNVLVKWLTFLSLYIYSTVALSASENLPKGWESYLDRPDILSINTENHNPDDSWQSLKMAHFSFVAEMLAFYSSETDLYFLARDSEFLYDVAKLVTEGTNDAKRIHLINVSRANMSDANLRNYLQENGITEEKIRAGKKIILIDTGFAGTIPKKIGDVFPNVRSKIKTHLIVSANTEHPSSRAFLIHLNPSANRLKTSEMHGSIVNYEHLARFSDRSSRFFLLDGKYHPISPTHNKTIDGVVSKSLNLRYMSDLKKQWENEVTKKRFALERKQITDLIEVLTRANPDDISNLKSILLKTKNTHEGLILESQIIDILDARSLIGIDIQIDPSQFGIHFQNKKDITVNSKKNEYILNFPDWAPILKNPDDEIPKLFDEKNWQMIGNLIDADIDYEINRLLALYLFGSPKIDIKTDLQKVFIENASQEKLAMLAFEISKNPDAVLFKKTLIEIIERSDQKTLAHIARNVLSKKYTIPTHDLIDTLINKGDHQVLLALATYVFAKDHTVEMQDLIEKLIVKANNSTLAMLAASTFSQAHTKNMEQAILLLIEKADGLTMQTLAVNVFSNEHTVHMMQALSALVVKADPTTVNLLKSQVFAKYKSSPQHLILLKSLNIKNIEQRKLWIQSQLNTFPEEKTQKISQKNISDDKNKTVNTHNPSNAEFSSTKKQTTIKPNLKPGDIITVHNRELEVIKKAGEGRRGIVYKVKAKNGAFYALKIAKDDKPETLESFAKESAKSKKWQTLKIPHSKVLIQEKTYVLKTWIEGIRGDEIIKRFNNGESQFQNAAQSILTIVEKIQAQGAYVGDFRPANLIWTGKTWVIIDSGTVQDNITMESANEKWNQMDERGPKFERRWQLPVPKFKNNVCESLY